MARRELQKATTRTGLDPPITRVALARVLEEQGLVHEPGDAAALRLCKRPLEPRELLLLFRLAAPEQERVEPDETPVPDVVRPVIRPEMAAPASDPFPIHRLERTARLTDVMVARDAQARGLEFR